MSDGNFLVAVTTRKRHRELYQVNHSRVPKETNPKASSGNYRTWHCYIVPSLPCGGYIPLPYVALCASACWFILQCELHSCWNKHNICPWFCFHALLYKQRKLWDALRFLWKQKEAKTCWMWNIINSLASLPFLYSRSRWGKASLICRAGTWLQLGGIC